MMIRDDNTLLRMKHAQRRDDELLAIIHILEDKDSHDNYFLKGEILYRLVDDLQLLVVPKGVQREGHFAHKKKLLRQEYYIPKLDDKIASHISNCVQCIPSNRKRRKQEG